MKKLLCAVIALLFAIFNSAVAEDIPIVWLWDIPLFQNIETVIAQFNSKTNVILEQNERRTTRYEIPKGDPLLNINEIPFSIELIAWPYDYDPAIGLGIPDGEIYGISLSLQHSTRLENHPELNPDEFLKIAESRIETIYQMLESKFGEPILSYLSVQNGKLFGTKSVLGIDYAVSNDFLCPSPYDANFKNYKETGASAISLNYCWGNVSMVGYFSPDESFRIEIEEKCWRTISFNLFEEKENTNLGDYFNFVEKQTIGVTSF